VEYKNECDFCCSDCASWEDCEDSCHNKGNNDISSTELCEEVECEHLDSDD
jgi:hypothetical protein